MLRLRHLTCIAAVADLSASWIRSLHPCYRLERAVNADTSYTQLKSGACN